MLFHLSGKVVGRTKGMDATAAAAYITRTKIEDRITGEVFDHTHHKDKPIYTERYLPEIHPDFAELKYDKKGNPVFGELWNLVEKKEKRKDSQFARNFILALQDEFTDEENKWCLDEWIYENFTSRGIVVDGAIHSPHEEEDGSNNKNKHAHVLATIRQVTKDGWNPKKDREANSKEFLKQLRKSWADINNEKFEEKFVEKHREEYDELFSDLEEYYPDVGDRYLEAVQMLYDKYPDEWVYISEKTLDEQREELEEWIETEEEQENYYPERIARYEKKFLSISFEAQKHLGPTAKAMQRKGKKTEKQAVKNDPKKKNKELEEQLAAVIVTDEEVEAELSEDKEYQALLQEKAAILEQLENISEAEEVKSIREQVDKILTQEEMKVWKETVWHPIETRIRKEAERQACFEDVVSEKSEVIESLKTAATNANHIEYVLLKEQQGSLELLSYSQRGKDYVDSGIPKQKTETVLKDMEELSGVAKFKDSIGKALSFIKNKASAIIEKSPLRKFKIFRAQKKIVDEWQPGILQQQNKKLEEDITFKNGLSLKDNVEKKRTKKKERDYDIGR